MNFGFANWGFRPRRVSSFTTPATTATSPTRRSSLKDLKHKLGMGEPDAGASRGDLAKLARMKSDLAVGNWRAREKTLIELDGLLSAKVPSATQFFCFSMDHFFLRAVLARVVWRALLREQARIGCRPDWCVLCPNRRYRPSR